MRVSDPSTASATVNVIVRVTEVNEPPASSDVVPTLLSVVERGGLPDIAGHHGLSTDGASIDADTYAVTDQDGSVSDPDGYDDTTPTYEYSVSGFDGE